MGILLIDERVEVINVRTGASGSSERRLQAAGLQASRQFTGEQIAMKVGVSARTIDNWRADRGFHALVESLSPSREPALRPAKTAHIRTRVKALSRHR
jgi:transcriptional regulator with XRE-family HTH domain